MRPGDVKFRGGNIHDRVHIIGKSEWAGQSGVVRGSRMANSKKLSRQRLVYTVELDHTGEKIGFFAGEVVSDNPLERLAAIDDEEA